MRNSLRLAVAGCHSQGKSTLCQDLMLRPEFKNFKLLDNITRDIKAKGVDINELGSDLSQSLVIARHIEHCIIPGNLLLDRCILDGMVYTAVLNGKHSVSEEVMQYAYYVFNQLISKYDVIFYVEPDLPLKKDGIRSVDIEFFNKIKQTFELFLQQEVPQDIFVVRISGTREERVQKVLTTLKEMELS